MVLIFIRRIAKILCSVLCVVVERQSGKKIEREKRVTNKLNFWLLSFSFDTVWLIFQWFKFFGFNWVPIKLWLRMRTHKKIVSIANTILTARRRSDSCWRTERKSPCSSTHYKLGYIFNNVKGATYTQMSYEKEQKNNC